MAQLPRVVVVDVPHHVTQRGNARQVILASDADRVTYLELLREYAQLYALSLLGYCLMSNHVHLIAVPHAPEALSQSLKQAHGRYAVYWNAQQSSTGHVWLNLCTRVASIFGLVSVKIFCNRNCRLSLILRRSTIAVARRWINPHSL